MNVISKDVIVVGGGAAGLMCAIEAGKRRRSVLVLEHTERLGKKILVSGGGRCNFTNLHVQPENYLSANPDFCKSALSRYPPADFIGLIEKHRISYHEKKLGQLFCDGSSRQIVALLEEECKAVRVEIRLGCKVRSIRKALSFQVETSQGLFSSDSLVIATGGLSFAKLGATDFGYRIAKEFDLKVTGLRPALVPLKFREPAGFGALSGISIDAVARCGNQSFRENILLTHRGLSGPAILQVSSFWREGESIEIDLLPGQSAESIFSNEHGNKTLSTVLSQLMPKRFVQHWRRSQSIPDQPLKQFSKIELGVIARRLHHWKITPQGTEGYPKAEVTLGGVSTSELSSKTMESRSVPGLYFIGEVVDVTGWLGGCNFQWAWASGHAAGQYA
ncbi:MAG: NAD(P)/FAD-dependent oxidoreductase [Verrucomicrobia bacterium]|nr:NAD(P)/FAD-dependent oxidoreductase [Verrucomicrobiota bacterium]